MKKISIAIISGPIGKTPEDITYSFVFDEAYQLARKGVSVHIVRSKIEGDSSSCDMHFHGLEEKIGTKAVGLSLQNLQVYPLFFVFRHPRATYWQNSYASNVLRAIEKNSIDLIHAHFAYPEGLVGLLAKRKSKKRLVVTVHGYDIMVEPSTKYGVRLDKRIDALVRRVLNGADAIIAASSATFKEASKTVNSTDKVHLIPNGVDVQRFNPNLDGSLIKKAGN